MVTDVGTLKNGVVRICGISFPSVTIFSKQDLRSLAEMEDNWVGLEIYRKKIICQVIIQETERVANQEHPL